MAHDSVQLMQVLDRYQTRLHQAGNEAHDEEFEYVRQIVSSPMFHQFLRGEMSHGEDLEISQASQDIISAEFSSEAVVNELTSSEIQKIRLARRKSLKALRNAVMPQSHPGGKKTHVPFDTSPASSPQQPHGLSRSRESSSSTTPSPLKHAHTKSHSGAEAAKMAVVPESRSTYPRTEHHGHKSEAAASLLTNGTDIDTPLEGLGNTHTPRRSREDASVLGPRIRNLSNSTNTLIERLSPAVFYGGRILAPLGSEGASPLQQTANINCPVLGLFGEEDQNPTPADVAEIEAELRKQGKDYEFHMYPGCGHGFHCNGRGSYRPESARDAWGKTMAWLDKHLKGE